MASYYTSKPNAILMVDAIMDEARAAQKEKRVPQSSNAIKLFRQRTRRKLSAAQAGELFDIVFAEYCKVSGARIGSTNN
jgi:hypothetical protein